MMRSIYCCPEVGMPKGIESTTQLQDGYSWSYLGQPNFDTPQWISSRQRNKSEPRLACARALQSYTSLFSVSDSKTLAWGN